MEWSIQEGQAGTDPGIDGAFAEVGRRAHGGEPAGGAEPVEAGTRLLLARRRGEPVGRVSIWSDRELQGAPGRSGLLGHYAAVDADAGVRLLEEAARWLGDTGVVRVLGPMNGSTWARYRLALAAEPRPPATRAEPPFPGEPWNPPDYPTHFEAAGFRPAAWYESRIDRELTGAHPRAAAAGERLREAGLVIRPLDRTAMDRDLDAIFDASLRAFADNLYYAPIDAGRFRAMYRPLLPRLDPELVLLAEDADGRPVGYAFAYGEPAGRVVLKTLATVPEARGLGLGTFLIDEVRRLALRKGHRAVIHALMHDDNASRAISGHTAAPFRRYVLYQWERRAPG